MRELGLAHLGQRVDLLLGEPDGREGLDAELGNSLLVEGRLEPLKCEGAEILLASESPTGP